jgi:hypothetical protein
MIVEKQIECRMAGETEFLEENLPKRHLYNMQSSVLNVTGSDLEWVTGYPH